MSVQLPFDLYVSVLHAFTMAIVFFYGLHFCVLFMLFNSGVTCDVWLLFFVSLLVSRFMFVGAHPLCM